MLKFDNSQSIPAKKLVCFHGYQTENNEKGNKEMFMYAYLGMSALVAGYFVAMYKIFY